jgi:hypothetical protein
MLTSLLTASAIATSMAAAQSTQPTRLSGVDFAMGKLYKLYKYRENII